MKRGPLLTGLAVGLVLVLLISIPALIGLLTDWYWFRAVGFERVFLTSISTRVLLGTFGTVLAAGFFYANLRFAQRGMVPDPVVVNINAKASRVDITRTLRVLALPVSVFLGVLFGASAAGYWLPLQQFMHRTAFGHADPVFGRDVGYYFFTMPMLAAVTVTVVALAVLALFLVVPLYLVRGDIVVGRRRTTIEPSAARHLSVLAAVFMLALSANVWWVRIPGLLYSTTGPIIGASHADLTARLPFLKLNAFVGVVAAGLALWGGRVHRLPRFLAIGAVIYLLAAFATRAYPAAIQQFVVAPNELARETPNIVRHIEATRRAWGLDDVEIRTTTGEARLTLQDVRRNTGTIKNVRLWDREPLLDTFGQLQEIRTYYDFVSVDDDRYTIDGEYRQVLLAPRELNSQSLPTRNFINEHLTFTHGMGATLSPVNQVTQQGLPTLFVQDLPPASSVSIGIVRPQIYFGELSNEYVFVNTRQPEFDYPSGDSTATTIYAGEGGVPVRSILRKAILSARFRALKILLSQDITNESRVLFYRNIRERAAKALPFLSWDSDPYLVIDDAGHLKWILDAYTRSGRYPYAQTLGAVNYMRNSVKVVIDAYDGTIDAYIAEPDDPLVRTFDGIFEGIFQPLDAMPADLRRHVRYPEDLFRAQTALFTTYHMGEPDIFYHREDQWQIPAVTREGARDPYLRHIVMKLPGEAQEEFIMMTPFTPRQKENLAAWMVARNDGEHYGELVVYRFPRQSLVFGPTQIVNRINQDTEISRQISLWDQRGSEVIRGNLLVIPIEESLLFVQALYLRAEGGRIPELKRVIVAFEDQVVMEETLDRSLTRLFGGSVERPGDFIDLPLGDAALVEADPAAVPAIVDLVRQAQDHYERALTAQREGDWATYGTEMDQVGILLRRLRDLTGTTP